MNSSSALGSSTLILKNQAAPIGSSFTRPGIVGQRFVDLHDLPVERGDDVGRGLDAFDDDDLVALGDLRLDLRQFHEHHVAQLLAAYSVMPTTITSLSSHRG
jgi:hypothetical protein